MSEHVTTKITFEARNLLRNISERTGEKQYSVVTRLLRAELKRITPKPSKGNGGRNGKK